MRISDWSSDVCSSDLETMAEAAHLLAHDREACTTPSLGRVRHHATPFRRARRVGPPRCRHDDGGAFEGAIGIWRQSDRACQAAGTRSEEHRSELQSPMRISYAGFCVKKKKTENN